MQRELKETSEPVSQSTSSHASHSSQQHGLYASPLPDGGHHHHQQGPLLRHGSSSAGLSSASTPRSMPPTARGELGAADAEEDENSGGLLDADQLAAELVRLSLGRSSSPGQKRPLPGQRISDYENALTPTTPKQALGFRVIKRPGSPSDGMQLTDFPNELLTHILSHLHPDSHAAVALVSKRFYALVTTSHAWRMAFVRQFPGRASTTAESDVGVDWEDGEASDRVRAESRSFARLTAHASWRTEYLLRTRLLRSLARGRPGALAVVGGPGAAGRSGGKRGGAVLTYNSKLPWMVSHVHAVFSPGGKKPPRAIHGAADLGVGTLSDPTSGKVEKWGLDDTFSFAQLDEVAPLLQPYGVADGPAANYNVMDVSQVYGIVGGEGFPGGSPYFRPVGESGRYLGMEANLTDSFPDVPKVPRLVDAISSVWIAKSSAVPSFTRSMIGIMTGSTLGVVTTYSLGYDGSGPRYLKGDLTCRWVLSPGVPIIALKLDENYNAKRKALRRVLAFALNALGEVFYLVDTPTIPLTRPNHEHLARDAWYAGRSATWKLVESTRRLVRPDALDQTLSAASSPSSSPSTSTGAFVGQGSAAPTKEQLISECREIERLMRLQPSHFREAFEGWDMRRKLEVDFAGGDVKTHGGESVVVIDCGPDSQQRLGVRRFTRRVLGMPSKTAGASSPVAVAQEQHGQSLFGTWSTSDDHASTLAAATMTPPVPFAAVNHVMEEWLAIDFTLPPKGNADVEITATAIDTSLYAVMGAFEDPLTRDSAAASGHSKTAVSDTTINLSKSSQVSVGGEIPGRRARLMGVGTSTGAVFVWDVREDAGNDGEVAPVRIIQTESPEISSLALSSLYLVHGGSDGLVQAWDPLASTKEPVRTLNSRSSGRLPRAILNANPMLRDANHSAVGAVFLDPDPAVLRGVLAFGTFLRYWSYSSTSSGPGSLGHKRRSRNHHHSHHQGSGPVSGGGGRRAITGYIAAEERELRREREHRVREQARLRARFGVGLAELSEEEAVRYAQMMSEESFLADEELRRQLSANASDDAASASPSMSSASSSSLSAVVDMVASESSESSPSESGSNGSATPAPSLSGAVRRHHPSPDGNEEENDPDYERQIQQAIRLSLLEAGVNDEGQSPPNRSFSPLGAGGSGSGEGGGASSSGAAAVSGAEFAFHIRYKKDKRSSPASPAGGGGGGTASSPLPSSSRAAAKKKGKGKKGRGGEALQLQTAAASSAYGNSGEADHDLELALRLSLEEAQARESSGEAAVGLGIVVEEEEEEEDFPALDGKGKGKWRAV